ncbi:DEAD-like helicase [European chub iridovirus]|nr:DEAD-like helicase [European chub iridovirus]
MEVFLSLFPHLDDPLYYTKIRTDSRLIDGLDVDVDLFAQQKYLARFMNPATPYTELLLYHEMGTGKTCTAVAIAEAGRKLKAFKGALILSRGEGLLKNFQYEIMNKCLSVLKSRNEMTQFYKFETFERFSKWVAKQSESRLRQKYAHYLIVVDEAHNLRAVNDTYDNIAKFMSLTYRCKKLLLTGTPMSDSADEIIDVLNLILPVEKKLVKSEYFTREGTLRHGKEDAFLKSVKGRVSYVRSKPNMGGTLEYKGVHFSDDPTFKIVPLAMQDYQVDAYNESYVQDQLTKSIYTNTRKTSLAALPPTADVKSYSVKYDYVLRKLRKARKAFIYCDLIKDTGIDLLASILNKLGWKKADKKQRKQSNNVNRYMIITAAEVTGAPKLLERFNAETNVKGDDVKLIIGSRAIAEGFTLRDVTDVFVLTPHWNFTETFQAIARAWRANSHVYTRRLLGKQPRVRVHVPVACVSTAQPLSTNPANSIDLHMLALSTRKDHEMKQVEYLLKLAAVDCAFSKPRNLRLNNIDYSRACDYKPCAYTCVDETVSPDTQHIWLPLDASPSVDRNSSNGVNLYGWSAADVPKLWYHWANKIQVTCFSGHKCYVYPAANARNDTIATVSVTLDAWSRGTALDDGYYLSRMVCKSPVKLSVAEICARRERRLIPTTMKKMFLGELPLIKTLTAMNKETQQKVLMLCMLSTAEKDSFSKTQKCKDVLYFYRGFWNPDTLQTWLFDVNAVLKQGASGRFHWSTDADNYGLVLKSRLLNSNTGYYGMYNPENNAFCIRDVRDMMRQQSQDLRRLTVGKRCTDWDQSELLRILTSVINVQVVDLYPNETYEQLKERCENVSKAMRHNSVMYNFSPQDRQQAVKFLYWTQKGQRRPEMCNSIKNWMERNDLLEHNFECGHHFKHRDVFANK